MRIRRENTPLNDNTYVCGAHFEGLRRADGDSMPSLFPWTKPARRRQSSVSRAAAVPAAIDLPTERRMTAAASKAEVEASMFESQAAAAVDGCGEAVLHVDSAPVNEGRCPQTTPEERCAVLLERYLCVCRELSDERAKTRKLEADLEAAKQQCCRLEERLEKERFSFKSLAEKPKLLKFYSGLEEHDIKFIMSLMGDSARSACRHTVIDTEHFTGHKNIGRRRCLEPQDELLLTLCKCRHNFPEEDLANKFRIHQTTVSRIFTAWMETLDACFAEVPLWPDKATIQQHMPSTYLPQYANTRVIVDAAEIAIERPQNPDTQSETWSEYKQRNTVKFLLGVTPNGVPSFVSDCYGGRISDQELTKASGLLGKDAYGEERFLEGDAIMCDKGFDIDELLDGRGISLHRPPYLQGKQQLTEDELIVTRRIASLRIQVERAIERVKNYRILQFLPCGLCMASSRLVRVCVFLTTLRPPLVPPDGQDY